MVCVCAQTPRLQTTRTRVLLLQHPRERDNAIGTAAMAHRALPGSILRAGVDFASDPVVQSLLAEAGQAYVLFPGPDATPIDRLPRETPLTLVILDGTWWQAGKLLRSNPQLATLPRVQFSPASPSDYRIRRQPAAHCVSTIEALAEVLAILEPDGARFSRLLDPFTAMVDRQIDFISDRHATRHRARPLRPRRRPTLGARLGAAGSQLVLLQGEANAWARRAPDRPADELLHVTALRPATGETFESLLAPRGRLAPRSPGYLEVEAARFTHGESPDGAARRWQDFCRADDVIAVWGVYHLGLARAAGWRIPTQVVDVRNGLSQHLKARVGHVEEGIVALGLPPRPIDPVGLPDSATASGATGRTGRAWRRLEALQRVVEALLADPEGGRRRNRDRQERPMRRRYTAS